MEFDIMLWIVPLMQAGILVLAVAGLYCLFCCEGKDHRSLVWTAAELSAGRTAAPGGRRNADV